MEALAIYFCVLLPAVLFGPCLVMLGAGALWHFLTGR